MDKWTILYYASGAGGLSTAIQEDLNELASVGSGNGVNFVVQYTSRRFGEPAKRYRVIQGGRDSEQDVGDVIPGDPSSLLDSLRWAVSSFPAQRFGLVLMGHGSGWRPEDRGLKRPGSMKSTKGALASWNRGLGILESDDDSWVDVINGRDFPVLFRTTAQTLVQEYSRGRAIFLHDITGHSLDSVELGALLDRATREILHQRFEFIGFDSCLMGCVEILTAISSAANYLIASEQLEPSRGWPHDTIAERIRSSAAAPTPDVLSRIPELYVNSYTVPIPEGITLAVLECSHVEVLGRAFRELSDLLLRNFDAIYDSFVLSLNRSLVFKADLWDIGSVVSAFKPRVSAEIQAVLGHVRDAAAGSVVAFKKSGNRVEKAEGISFYVPGYDGYSAYYDQTQFGSNGWREFIRRFRPPPNYSFRSPIKEKHRVRKKDVQ